jgi:cellulose synthase/poly-beta-1,6-N-acetylglucosamine synthase-like glycosyltransferase
MTQSHILNTSLEINLPHIRRRLIEILPGFLSWTTLIGLSVLALVIPYWVAIFIIVYDVYVLIRAIYMSVHLVYAYRRLRKMSAIDWLTRCKKVCKNLDAYITETTNKLATTGTWQLKQLHQNLLEIKKNNVRIFPWDQVHHVVVLPTYNESISVLRSSLESLTKTSFPKNRMHIVVGFEKRIGKAAYQKADILTREFSHHFGTFLTTFHPDGLPGEKQVKSANATWAIKKIEGVLNEKNIPTDNILVSNFDSDTVVGPSYFSHLTYNFITHPDRYHISYQPLPMYHNNVWDAPSFSRVIATGSTFWQMIESTRPERLVTFSSHSMTLRALKDVNYWQTDIISEDSRIFWQCLLRYNGHYRTEPLYTSVSMDAALADTWWQTLKNQYKQKRRWAWGIENFPYLALGFLQNKKISLRTKLTYTLRTLEGHFSWATTPIIVAGLGWLPIFFGSPDFHSTVLSYSLPYMTRTIMTIAMFGLLISTALSLLLLPARPSYIKPWRYIPMTFQWALFPFIATMLSAFPALDAETRLMLGRDLHFNVMQKTRKMST